MAGPRMHQLSNGMFVSGPPELPKERSPTMGSRAMPYTGGDVRKSGELGKMFDIPVLDPASAAPGGSRPNSGQLPRSSPSSGSGQVPRRTSGPLSQIPPTGLITSGPLRRSGGQQPEQSPAQGRKKKKEGYGPAVTMVEDKSFECGVPRVWVWVLAVVFLMGIGAGAFVWAAVGRPEILAGVVAVAAAVAALAVWNWSMGRREAERFLRRYPNTSIDPRDLPVGKFVKITGHVTCGSIPLETSYGNVPRCIFASTKVYSYQGWKGLLAKRTKWELRSSERHVADFYISDPNSGTRFLVRAGNGARITSFVNPTTVLEVNAKNKQQNPDFESWLTDRGLSGDNRAMCLKEGYIKEGNTASVMGILRRHQNLVIIDPPTDVVSTGCQWTRFFFPIFVEGLVIIGDERPDEVVYQV